MKKLIKVMAAVLGYEAVRYGIKHYAVPYAKPKVEEWYLKAKNAGTVDVPADSAKPKVTVIPNSNATEKSKTEA